MQKFIHDKVDHIIKKEEWLYHIIPIQKLRQTSKVDFDAMPFFREINWIDIVTHQFDAHSPALPCWDNDVWYMHPWQEDNLITLSGNRYVELYNPNTKEIEKFEISHDCIKLNWVLIHEWAGILWWSENVFHRNYSAEGSVSMNFAVRDEKFDIDSEFNIYKLDIKTWEYKVARVWKEDQPTK